ncbi:MULTISPECIES: DUF4270 domain-containing protein [Chryseobacterium]|jgi:hypothetical protein|uniref:DUF4270 domain-containing protein n=1 Tax=Chryseobacterium geocarposphaerae TaxID=1416776 RepID=A0ABU1LH54_9FLAO|nr:MULTISPECIES: DUF4270 domain-containing protein [Chryseobacterium]ALR29187.1 hypothetical protein ATE47_00955 [Chryseobacterium sp. IHB B 17019]MDR6406056.1 hypothetical protein [Chryseobacterium geocarposphaerae]MDR6699499.1 hypothetical protein [Chryseobacterium ginsenosidimutans]
MTHTIKKAITVLSMVIFGSVLLYNCEPDADSLGEQLFLDGAAQGNEKSFEVVAFNIDNNDSIRTEASKLSSAVLGAFDEPQFGRQKASYLTQLRLSTYDPDFGANAVVDSVVLVMKPTYASDSVTTTTDESFVFAGVDGNVDAKKVVNTYPVVKYGKAKKTLNIKVNEVTEFLKSSSDTVKSNQAFAFDPTVLGSKEFKGKVSSVTITKDSDGSALFTASSPGIRIPLDKTFFQNKIIAKKDQPELQDASNFIRHIRGLRISVEETDGYLFQFSPNDMELIMYYKYDKTDVTPATRPQATYTFALGSANTHIGQYEYNRTGSAWSSATIGDQNNGAPKLFLQGMGGPSIGVKIPDATINELKQLYQDKKAAIIGAKIRIYTDPVDWNNNYAKPTAFTFLQKDKKDNKTTTGFTADVLNLIGSPGFSSIYKIYDLDKNPTYYEFIVTKSVKNIVEGEESNAAKYFRIDMGSFQSNTDGTLAGARFTSRAYNTSRAVFVGSQAGNANRVQLKVIYGTK